MDDVTDQEWLDDAWLAFKDQRLGGYPDSSLYLLKEIWIHGAQTGFSKVLGVIEETARERGNRQDYGL